MRKYRQAHEAGDLQALMALVYWEGSTERTRELIVKKLKKYLGYSIKEIEVRPLCALGEGQGLAFGSAVKVGCTDNTRWGGSRCPGLSQSRGRVFN